LAVQASAVPDATTPAVGSAEAGSASEADEVERLVVDWLTALGASDMEKLADRTSIPFSFRTTNKLRTCERTVGAAAEMSRFVSCLRARDGLFVKELRYVEELVRGRVQLVDLKEVSQSLRPLLYDLKPDEVVVTTFIQGNVLNFSLVVVFRREEHGFGVRLLATNAEFESG
jgi:hypothetical protein